MIDILLVTVIIICVITDIKNRKIYNKVIYPALLAGFLLHFVFNGLSGIGYSFLGFLVGIALLFIPYALGGMGAGDVKLLGLIGALKGSLFVFQTFLYTAIFGGIIALVIVLMRNGMLQTMVNNIFTSLRLQYRFSGNSIHTFPYGVPIAAGVLLALVMSGGWLR